MSKIYLSGNREIGVSASEAERIEQEWSHKAEFIKINDQVTVKNREIKRVEKSKRAAKTRYDLGDPDDKKAIVEFEKFYEGLRTTSQTENPLDYYGPLLKDQVAFPGYVLNELLGGVHWSLVDWALRKGIMSRREKPYLNWAIVSSESGDTGLYDELRAKIDAFMELEGRRQFARKAAADAAAISAQKAELSGEMEFPAGDPDLDSLV